MNTSNLPPLFGGFKDGIVNWQPVAVFDYDTLGFMLTCHLVIEHYMDEFIATQSKLGLENARLSFNQKLSLLSTHDFPARYQFLPALKHLNALRNNCAHNLNANIGMAELRPLSSYVEASKNYGGDPPEDPNGVLSVFAGVVCSHFALMVLEANSSSAQLRVV
jgi:hypothetical protein